MKQARTDCQVHVRRVVGRITLGARRRARRVLGLGLLAGLALSILRAPADVILTPLGGPHQTQWEFQRAVSSRNPGGSRQFRAGFYLRSLGVERPDACPAHNIEPRLPEMVNGVSVRVANGRVASSLGSAPDDAQGLGFRLRLQPELPRWWDAEEAPADSYLIVCNPFRTGVFEAFDGSDYLNIKLTPQVQRSCQTPEVILPLYVGMTEDMTPRASALSTDLPQPYSETFSSPLPQLMLAGCFLFGMLCFRKPSSAGLGLVPTAPVWAGESPDASKVTPASASLSFACLSCIYNRVLPSGLQDPDLGNPVSPVFQDLEMALSFSPRP